MATLIFGILFLAGVCYRCDSFCYGVRGCFEDETSGECKRCEEITFETECRFENRTCLWTCDGKCKSLTCSLYKPRSLSYENAFVKLMCKESECFYFDGECRVESAGITADIVIGVVLAVVVLLIVVALAILLKTNKLSQRPFEVLIYSVIPYSNNVDFCKSCFANVFIWLLVVAVLVILPLFFAIVSYETVQPVVTPSIVWGEYDSCAEPSDAFYEVFGGFSWMDTAGTNIMAWGTVYWVFFDAIMTMFVVYRNMAKINPCKSISPCCMTMIVLLFQFTFAVFDVLGLFFDSGQRIFAILLLIWPISNFMRLVDVVVTVVSRSNVVFLTPCFRKKYNRCFFILNAIGTSGGFMLAGDPFWEKILSVVIEVIDFIFSLMFVLYDHALFFSMSTRNTLTVLKIVALSLKVALSFKSYISVAGSYMLGLLLGALLGIGFFVTFLLIELLAMRKIGDYYTQVEIMIPLLLVIFFLAVLVGLCGRTEVPCSSSAFEPGNGDEDEDGDGDGKVDVRKEKGCCFWFWMSWNGECFPGVKENGKAEPVYVE